MRACVRAQTPRPRPSGGSCVAALLDIPIHKSKIESLHVLFSLFVEFKNSQHFRTEEETQALNNVDVVAAAEPDVMVL